METKDHFDKIFWFIVGLCVFGAALTIFLIIYLPTEDARRVADTSLIFWLSTAVAGGIGWLIGSSASKSKATTDQPGTTSVDLQVTQTKPDEVTDTHT